MFRSSAIDLVGDSKKPWQDSMDECGKMVEHVEEAGRSAQKKGLAALTKALNANGFFDRDKNRVVDIEKWREWCNAEGVKDASFRAMKKRLLDSELIVEDGHIVRHNRS